MIKVNKRIKTLQVVLQLLELFVLGVLLHAGNIKNMQDRPKKKAKP
jgi:hypothetical protein